MREIEVKGTQYPPHVQAAILEGRVTVEQIEAARAEALRATNGVFVMGGVSEITLKMELYDEDEVEELRERQRAELEFAKSQED